MIDYIIGGLAGFIGGGFVAYFIWDKAINKKKKNILAEAEKKGK